MYTNKQGDNLELTCENDKGIKQHIFAIIERDVSDFKTWICVFSINIAYCTLMFLLYQLSDIKSPLSRVWHWHMCD